MEDRKRTTSIRKRTETMRLRHKNIKGANNISNWKSVSRTLMRTRDQYQNDFIDTDTKKKSE